MRTAVAVATGLLIIALSAASLRAADAPPPAPAAEKASPAGTKPAPMARTDEPKLKEWLALWEKNITKDAANRYCDKSLAEDIGWLMTPFLDGFYYGYMATKDAKWIDLTVDWADSWIKRALKEPDGYLGWPNAAAAGTLVDDLDSFNADSLLGEAMALRPIVLLAAQVLKTPALKEKYGAKAESYLKLAEQMYEKWDNRGAWRETKDGGLITVVMPFGLDQDPAKWTSGYATRGAPGAGFSHPNNKANHVARWLLALFDATGKPVYKDRAAKWFKLMKSRMTPTESGAYKIWNYWEPAGPWDLKPDGKTKHWVGTHPNGGYYSIDTQGIVDAYEHGLVFTREDIDRLIATAITEKRYWASLVPYSEEIQKKFEAEFKPDTWGGLASAPWYLYQQAKLRQAGK